MDTKVKKENDYRITIEEVTQNIENKKNVTLNFEDRENLFSIIDNINQYSGLEKEDATRLAIAIRLLGPVMMKDRKHPLFVDFMPHFKNFMQNLKTTVKNQEG